MEKLPALPKGIERLIKRVGLTKEDREDCRQEALIAMWQSQQKAKCHAPGYAYRTARGKVLHWQRDKKERIRIPRHIWDRKQAAQFFNLSFSYDELNPNKEPITEFEEKTLEAIDLQQKLQAIFDAAKRLSPRQREVIYLLAGGAEVAQIAALLKLSRTAIYSCRQIAIYRLKKFLCNGNKN